MTARRRFSLLVALGAALGLAGTVAGGSLTAGPGPGEPALHSAAWVRDRNIAFYEARMAQDPAGALDRARLATLYLQRGTVTGSEPDLARAETAARGSLARRRPHNAGALAALTAALMSRHRFSEARDAARELVADAPDSEAARALLGEVLLELGEYREARGLFGSVLGVADDPSIAARLARWHEIEGRVEIADRLLRAARERALGLHGLPAEQRAWFHLRVGDLALRYGRLREARSALEAGIAESPQDHRLLAARARLAAARGEWHRALADGERTLAIAFDPATLGVVAEAHAALGDTAAAGRFERVIETTLLAQPGSFHRSWSLHLLERRRLVPEVLRRAEAELQTRRDVYGWQVYALALHESGRHREAAAAIDSALAAGTRDPRLLRHARLIREAAAR